MFYYHVLENSEFMYTTYGGWTVLEFVDFQIFLGTPRQTQTHTQVCDGGRAATVVVAVVAAVVVTAAITATTTAAASTPTSASLCLRLYFYGGVPRFVFGSFLEHLSFLLFVGSNLDKVSFAFVFVCRW